MKKLYRKGNYFIEIGSLGKYELWNMRSLIAYFDTMEEAIKHIEEKQK